ncbi:hypothetical protein Nepgr_025068 [Nepenthes gracilis]|uniref:Inactive heme oxygenase 2, chloroplastic n=1 Tax=Nepenthes gracilis TaxID=150966 RepID=A0AAD3T4E0_NEPGR|nr:hypothetical protein Nepgr_025068 [Nepenthes gracilis]
MAALQWCQLPAPSLLIDNNCPLSLSLSLSPHTRSRTQISAHRSLLLNQRQRASVGPPIIVSCYSETTTISTTASSSDASSSSTTSASPGAPPPPLLKKRKRYRRAYPGENKGITEEMRFVAMKLRNAKPLSSLSGDEAATSTPSDQDNASDIDGDGEINELDTWQPSLEGFLKYLVDSKLVFQTLERVVEESNDVSYAYFRKTGLERSARLSMDLEWFCQKNIMVPEPSNHGLSYAEYLEQVAEKSGPLFLSHLYNIYFSHIAGGQVISRQVSKKILGGRELEFYRWEGDAQVLLKDVREKLNRLSEHWSRDDKNKCLKETTKSFRFLGQIVRLIIL